MKAISRSALQQYGINHLTGEADAYSRRILCDLSQRGVNLIRAYFGMPETVEVCNQFHANWNSRVGTEDAIASMLIDRNAFQDILIFALLHVDRYDVVIDTGGGNLLGVNVVDPYYENWMEDAVAGSMQIYRNTAKNDPSVVNGRHVHAYTGRTA